MTIKGLISYGSYPSLLVPKITHSSKDRFPQRWLTLNIARPSLRLFLELQPARYKLGLALMLTLPVPAVKTANVRLFVVALIVA